MESDKIEKLLERYEEGHTTLHEENLLREYFQKENIPAYLESYRPLFGYAAKQREIKYQGSSSLKKKNKFYAWAGVASIVIIGAGLYFFQIQNRDLQNESLGTITDKELALEKSREALEMVSQLMNTGSSDLIYLKEFNKTQKKIIQID